MAKIRLTEATKAYFSSGIFLTTTFYVGQAIYNNEIFWPIAVGFGLPSLIGGINMLGRLRILTSPSRSPGPRFYGGRRSIPINANGKGHGNIFMNVIKWRANGVEQTIQNYEPVKGQYEFWESGMKAIVPEGELYRFCKIAWGRQRQVDFGNNDIKPNQILSRTYFVHNTRPRVPTDEYQSILWILESRNLVLNRRQGKSGRMRFPPHITVAEAKARWN